MNNFIKPSKQIREEFIEFFESKGHKFVPSASLVPTNDPTLLFTNAGMNQFKDVFLGTGSRSFKRAVNSQKVMRVSGKHNDFDDVGRDTYHHTFFEMLGNWSFGDYYKKEAITWAWELITDVWKIPKERLYATVYELDKESFDIWKNYTDIDVSHILSFGKKENFWEMGATGPCGPCSEIHIDLTPDILKSKGSSAINSDDPLFIELWNLVFIQYNRKEDSSLEDLPAKHVDTGMGFERIVAVLQNKLSNYDSDLFTPIISDIVNKTSMPYNTNKSGTPHRVIADHIRALTFAIADGVMPSNEGRGYIIRKILRRAVRFGRELGYKEPFLYTFVPIVVSIMGDFFPEIRDRSASIESVIQAEEESFFRTLNKGFEKIKELINKTKSNNMKEICGEDVFLLYDSMGFPVDFTEQILKDEDLFFDKEKFDLLMNEQKEKARKSWKGEGINISGFENLAKTKYIDEEAVELRSIILGLVSENKKVSSVLENEEVSLILDKTAFYGEKGGQKGDSGFIKNGEENIIAIFDTKIFEEKHIHIGKVIKGSFSENQEVTLSVDAKRKKNIARHHSTAHLLFKALRTVLGDHIGQAGSSIGENRTRIDFTHPKAISTEELEKIEKIVNDEIIKNSPTIIREMPIDSAKKLGAIAAFEEKYGEIVRVVEIGESIELCGGTHISNTGELGLVLITHESSISAGTRRIEAISGESAYECIKNTIHRQKNISQILKCNETEILNKLQKITTDSKNKDILLKNSYRTVAKSIFQDLIKNAKEIQNHSIIIGEISTEIDILEELRILFKNDVDSGVLILGIKKSDNTVLLTTMVSKNLTNVIKAGDLIQKIVAIIGGKGGGKSDYAIARGKNSSELGNALSTGDKIITDIFRN